MIIGVDGTSLLGPRTGIGLYLGHLLDALSRVMEEDKAYVWMNNPTPEEKSRVFENRYLVVNATHYPWPALKLTWNTLGTPSADSLVGRPADVYFYPNYLPLPQKQGKKVLFLHDLTFLTHPEMISPEVLKNLTPGLEKQVEKADLVLTCSEYNRQVLARAYPRLPESRVRVVPFGLPDRFRKPAAPEAIKAARDKYALTKPYFLYAGSLELRKNLLRLVHAFLLFKQKATTHHELVLAGPKGWIGEEFMSFLLAPQLSGKVRWLDAVPQEDLPGLYTGASAFLYPASEESFGMPLLEAMGCGVPVLCSNVGAIPEVVGDGAWMMPPTNLADWCNALERIANEPAFDEVLKQKGRMRASLFPMDNAAKQVLAALKLASQVHA